MISLAVPSRQRLSLGLIGIGAVQDDPADPDGGLVKIGRNVDR
jgi:hypothetical protein